MSDQTNTTQAQTQAEPLDSIGINPEVHQALSEAKSAWQEAVALFETDVLETAADLLNSGAAGQPQEALGIAAQTVANVRRTQNGGMEPGIMVGTEAQANQLASQIDGVAGRIGPDAS